MRNEVNPLKVGREGEITNRLNLGVHVLPHVALLEIELGLFVITLSVEGPVHMETRVSSLMLILPVQLLHLNDHSRLRQLVHPTAQHQRILFARGGP